MKLYFLTDEHRYVHRQSDIPKGASFEVRDIPTDLAGLMAYLNGLLAAHHKEMCEQHVEASEVMDAIQAEVTLHLLTPARQHVTVPVNALAEIVRAMVGHDATLPHNFGSFRKSSKISHLFFRDFQSYITTPSASTR